MDFSMSFLGFLKIFVRFLTIFLDFLTTFFGFLSNIFWISFMAWAPEGHEAQSQAGPKGRQLDFQK